MEEKQEKVVQKKGRLTLTGNKIPDDVYKMLEEKGKDRKLTPYVVSLVEKEEMMDKLIESLSTVIQKVDRLDRRFTGFEAKLEGVDLSFEKGTDTGDEEIKQGDLEIADNIIGGIEEDIDETDF